MKKIIKIIACTFLSFNMGYSQWQSANNGISDFQVYAIAIDGSNIFAATEAGVYLSTDNGSSWTAKNNGITHLLVYEIVISGSNIYAGTLGGGVFLSTDDGNNWSAINNGLDLFVTSIAISGNNIFAGTWSGVFLSTDNGSNWIAVNSGLSGFALNVYSIAISGSNIFVGTDNGVYLSINNGEDWTAVNSGMSDMRVNSILVSGSDIFTGTYNGIFLSIDDGNSWSPMNNGLTGQATSVFSLAMLGNNIFAGTLGEGVFLSTDNANSWTAVSDGLSGGSLIVYPIAINESNIFAGTQDYGMWKRLISDILILDVSTNSIDIDSLDNSSEIFEITSNTYWTISISEPWLAVDSENGYQDATITLTAQENETSATRTAVVTVSSSGLTDKTITVSQANIEKIHSFTIQDVTVDEGQPIEVPISVSELTAADNIISYQFDINFDHSILEYIGNDISGTLAEGGTVEVNTNTAGKLSISYMNNSAIVGTGEILKLQFNTLSTDTTGLIISNAYLNSTDVDSLSNGTVIINDITPPTAEITYNDTDVRIGDDLIITATFSEHMLEGNAVNISLSGAATQSNVVMTRLSETVYTYSYHIPKTDGDVTVSLSNGTDLWSNEVVSVPTSGDSFTIIGLTLGDVDDDGKILAYDAALTLQHSIGFDPLPAIDPLPWENWRVSTANVDGVGVITANDAGMILQYSTGIITSFISGKKKTASIADVTIEVVNNDIVFYSNGELLGLNLSTTNENGILGTPEILAENFMSAFNISGTTYNIGLCTANSPEDGTAIMKIPFNFNRSVTFDMNINTEEKIATVDLVVTGLDEHGNVDISIYPNPAKEYVNIGGLTSPTVIKMYNSDGKLLFTSMLTNPEVEINVSIFPVGLYIIKLETYKEINVKGLLIR